MEKSDIDQLRNRLNERINQLRQKRNAPGANTANPRSRDDILAARNKKKEDRKKAIKAQKEKGGKVASEELVKFDDRKVTFLFGDNLLYKLTFFIIISIACL
jgi:hypothetical protein